MSTVESVKQSQDNVSEFLPYDLPYMTDELRKRAKAELYEDDDTREHSLELLKAKLNEEKELRLQDNENFRIAFLRARKFNTDRAAMMTKNFYLIKRKYKEVYHNFNYADVKKTLEDYRGLGFLPYRDAEGCAILMFGTEKWEPNVHSMSNIMRMLTTGIIHAICSPSTQVAGIKVIVNFKGLTLAKMSHITPRYLFLFAEALQNGFPARFRGVHIVNHDCLFIPIWSVLKMFLNKKLRDRMYLHGTNLAKLHSFFSTKILPHELGGELPPYDNTDWARNMEQTAAEITEILSYGYETSNNT